MSHLQATRHSYDIVLRITSAALHWLGVGVASRAGITMVVKLKAEMDSSGNMSRLVAIHYIRRCVNEAMPCKFQLNTATFHLRTYVPHKDENILQ